MNNARRKTLKAALEKVEAMQEALQGAIEDVLSDVQGVLDEEQEAHDNLPESLQEGDRGQAIQEKIDLLEQAVSALEELQGFDFDTVIESIEGAL